MTVGIRNVGERNAIKRNAFFNNDKNIIDIDMFYESCGNIDNIN